MSTTGRAKGPRPHRTSCEGNQKARSGAASPKGFTVRCFWVAARDWPCRVHRQTKGGFVRSNPADPAKVRPASLGHFDRTCSHPPAPAAAGIIFLDSASSQSETRGVMRDHTQPSPFSVTATARPPGLLRKQAPPRWARLAPSLGTLSAGPLPLPYHSEACGLSLRGGRPTPRSADRAEIRNAGRSWQRVRSGPR